MHIGRRRSLPAPGGPLHRPISLISCICDAHRPLPASRQGCIRRGCAPESGGYAVPLQPFTFSNGADRRRLSELAAAKEPGPRVLPSPPVLISEPEPAGIMPIAGTFMREGLYGEARMDRHAPSPEGDDRIALSMILLRSRHETPRPVLPKLSRMAMQRPRLPHDAFPLHPRVPTQVWTVGRRRELRVPKLGRIRKKIALRSAELREDGSLHRRAAAAAPSSSNPL